MQMKPPMEPPDDDGISITDLDSGDKKQSKFAGLQHHALHFFLQTKRKFLGVATIGAIMLLLFVIFAPSFLPKPISIQKEPKANVPAPVRQASAVETSYTFNKVIYINTLDGSVNALQASSGKSLWHFRPALPASRPLNIVQDMVYFTAGNNQKSFVYALQTSDGRPRWQRQLPDVNLSLVSVHKDALYFTGLNSEVYTLRSKDGSVLWQYKGQKVASHSWLTVADSTVYLTDLEGMTLTALQASTGTVLWRKQGAGAVWLLATTPDIAYIQLSNTTFYAIKTSDGTQLWKYTGIEQGGSFVLEQSRLYLTTNTGTVVALNARDGSFLWQYKEMYPIWGSLVVAPHALYLNALDGNIYALQASNGRQLWHYRLSSQPDTFAPPISGQVYTGNKEQIYVATNNGITYVFQASTGALLWQYHTGQILPARRDETTLAVQPAIQPAIYIVLHDNTFLALRLQDGALLWHYNKAIQEPPLLEQGIIYASAQDGTINALNAETGSLRWNVSLPN